MGRYDSANSLPKSFTVASALTNTLNALAATSVAAWSPYRPRKDELNAALAAFPGKPVEAHKARKGMVHRYFAGTLGLLIGLIAGLAWRQHRALQQSPALPTALLVVVGRIALGGWVSSNYAALACGDFLTCLGGWMPEMDFAQAFAQVSHLHRELGQTADGALLSNAALTAIHWSYRVGALVVTLIVGSLVFVLARRPGRRNWAWPLATCLLIQIGLGIANVLLALPLPIAVAYNAGAAILLTVTLALNVRLGKNAAVADTRAGTPVKRHSSGWAAQNTR